MADIRIKRNGNYLAFPFFGVDDREDHPEEIGGIEDVIPDPEHLGAPFTVSYNKGSVREFRLYNNYIQFLLYFKY